MWALYSWFRPLCVALFNSSIPWKYRWRLALLQPISLLTYSIGSFPYIFSRPFYVEYLPIFPKRSVRALVFKTPGTGKGRRLRPLHIEIHGGAFIGGLPESNARFDERVAVETGAVVVSLTYRYAPEHPFPAGIDDIDATIAWIIKNAESRWGADSTLMTIGGFSAGGNLALAATQQPELQAPSPTSLKASVTFYASIDLRIPPWEKPKPARFPKTDPLAFLLPLFDSYPGPVRASHAGDPRMSPVIARGETLPPRMLMAIPAIDILVGEQQELAERLNAEQPGRVEVYVEPEGFHGYLEVPDAAVKKEVKDRAFDRAIKFLINTHGRHGWAW
ncbi:unnamed protein product [Clonostachys byssicola]|uniref:Alpha/beta hydrolase fold-3 domain-containing protein n=1 Tax=Clonostachys byssicola TaxID=160290 RepID=A0A9N9U714_9HYPO|nr:unnamed protein product [Clonostachys byssicola]